MENKNPSENNFFLWLSLRNSTLAKVNLIKRGWKGSANCHFCGGVESTDHIFISCSVAKLIWSIMLCAFDVGRKPESVQDLFGGWLRRFVKKKKSLIIVGIAALLWAIWNARNEICFENKKIHDPFVIIHRVTQLINSWAILQPKQGSREELMWGAKLLERVASEIFSASRGWRPGTLRIAV